MQQMLEVVHIDRMAKKYWRRSAVLKNKKQKVKTTKTTFNWEKDVNNNQFSVIQSCYQTKCQPGSL